MKKLKSLLAVPLIFVAAGIARLFGLHFCAEEAMVLGLGAATLPFVGPMVRAKLSKRHCCDPVHRDHLGVIFAPGQDTVLITPPPEKPEECDDPFCPVEFPHRNRDHAS